jgi:hypothetical protein
MLSVMANKNLNTILRSGLLPCFISLIVLSDHMRPLFAINTGAAGSARNWIHPLSVVTGLPVNMFQEMPGVTEITSASVLSPPKMITARSLQ